MFSEQNLRSDLKVDEGDERRPYKDTRGFWTVAIGHNLDVSPLPSGMSYPLTDDMVNAIFERDISGTLARLDARLPGWRDFPEPIARSLANMGFNMGVGQWGKSGLLEFTTFIGLLKAHNYAAAADDLIHTAWHSQVGDRALRIEALIRSVH
jgi:lysozyme